MTKIIRKEILIGAAAAFGVLCLLALGLYFFLANPRSVELSGVAATFAAKQAELDGLSAETVKSLKAEAEKYRSDLSEYMVLAGQQGELSIKLRQLAADNRLDEFSSKDASNSLFADAAFLQIAEQRINISFSGDFGGFAGFLQAIEKNHPAVFVDGFSISHDSKDDTRMSASMESTILYEQRSKR